MSNIFGSVYADTYNLLYADKDYDAECRLIEELFHRHSPDRISNVLDLGCGTGNHVFSMSERGYNVVGVDRSENMIALAEQRLQKNLNSKVRFRQGDLRSVELDSKFDAALMMFAVLGYQVENSDVLSALKTARRHLKLGGLLIFDVWYGPAVLHQRPSERFKVIPTKEGKILRFASGELDVSLHSCKVRLHVWRLAQDRLLAETEEVHVMRYFFPLELNLFLAASDFMPLGLRAFPDLDKLPDETTWNVVAVARAV
jgi:SAM-dependent methyltransferase